MDFFCSIQTLKSVIRYFQLDFFSYITWHSSHILWEFCSFLLPTISGHKSLCADSHLWIHVLQERSQTVSSLQIKIRYICLTISNGYSFCHVSQLSSEHMTKCWSVVGCFHSYFVFWKSKAQISTMKSAILSLFCGFTQSLKATLCISLGHITSICHFSY